MWLMMEYDGSESSTNATKQTLCWLSVFQEFNDNQKYSKLYLVIENQKNNKTINIMNII